MNTAPTVTRIPLSYGTIAAIIRKDMRALWPFALALAAFVLAMTALFRSEADYPEVVLHFGASQLHLAPVLFLLNAFGLPISVATFIVLLVHQDPATDARNDWMVRPISALDLVAAKALVILVAALIPAAVGYSIYVATHDNVSIDVAMGSIVSSVIVCIFVLVVAWLASSPVQALLAPFVLAVGALLLALSLGLAIRAGIMDTDAARSLALADTPVEYPTSGPPPAPTAPGPVEAASPAPSATAPVEQAMPAPAPPPGVEQIQGRRMGRDATDRVSDFVDVRQIERSASERRPERVIDLTWPIVIGELLLMLGAAGVVLWLLLVRRKLLAARMTFLGFFAAAILLLLLQGAVSTPRDEMIAFQRVSVLRPSPPEAERFAAFAKHDANGDQRLDRREYAGVLEELGFSEQFDSLWMQRDDNMDGFITAQEYRAAIPAAPGGPPAPDVQRFAAFTKHDANADRRLDRNEYRAVLGDLGFAPQFDTLWMQRDGDKDGFVSAEEYGMPAQ